MNTEVNTDTNKLKPETNNRIEYGKIVGKVATMIQQDGALSTGEKADLRRISPDQPFTPALWRILMVLDLDQSPGWIRQEHWERRWATLFMGMAHCAGLHSYQTSLGEALAEAGWSELRFVQLMRAKEETLETHLRRVAQFLAGKNQEANWTDTARLLFFQSDEVGEKVRLSISREFYSTLYKKEQASK